MGLLKKLNEKGEEILMAFSIWGIVLIMGLQIFLRYIFGEALAWPEELSRYLFIWFTFLGMSYSIKNKSHIRIDILELSFPKLQKSLEIIGDVIFFLFAAIMLPPGARVIRILWETNQTSPGLQAPMYLVYSSVFVGFILVIIRLVQKYAAVLAGKKSLGTANQQPRSLNPLMSQDVEVMEEPKVIPHTGGGEV